MIALTLPAPQAAAFLLPLLLAMDATGLQQLWRERDRALLLLRRLVPYTALGLMDLRNLATSLLLLPLAPLGVWAGVWLLRRVSGTWFYRLAYLGMFLTGTKLLWDGLK